MTFEPRHENKSCSACPDDQLELFQISNFQVFKFLKKNSNFQNAHGVDGVECSVEQVQNKHISYSSHHIFMAGEATTALL